MSTNLNLSQVTANQNQKEVTINDAFGQVDAAVSEILAVDLTSGNVTLTTAQFRSAVMFLAQNNSVSRNLTIAAVKRGFFGVHNSGSANLVVIKGSTSITMATGDKNLFYTDGTTNSLFKITDVLPATTPYDIGFFAAGKPGASAICARYATPRAVALLVGLPGSVASAETASTGNVSFDLQVNGVSKGSVTFNASSTGSFTFSNAVNLVSGDVVKLIGPGTQDATLADVSITLKATR